MPAQEQQAQAPAAPRPALARQGTLRDRLQAGAEELHRRLEPMVGAASSAVDELNVLLDPGAIEEALHERKPADTPPSPPASAAGAAAESKEAERLGAALLDPRKIMLQDKLAFMLGVCNVCLTAFWVGRWPSTYHLFWLLKDLVLFTLRFLVYKQEGMHYMMLEYCYVANLLALYHVFVRPQSALLRRFSFAVMSGPLMWSIVAMRNSLVFHSGDHITTLMMHASPALSAWCMRWYPQESWTAGMSAAELADWNSASWVQMAVVPAALNVLWVAVYYLIIFVAVNKRIQERGYQNMFTAMVTRPSARKSALAKLVLSVPEPVQPLFYLGIHTCMAWLALLPTKIWFDHFWAHTAVLLAILLVAAWNGATWYFRVFAKQLIKEEAARQAAAGTKKAA